MSKNITTDSEQGAEIIFFQLDTCNGPNILETSLISWVRLWFSGEYFRRKMNCTLNIQYGYFRGYRISKSINELFLLINLYRPFLSINCLNYPKISNDEKGIVQLIYPNLFVNSDNFNIVKKFVPESEFQTLVRLAKAVNFSLNRGYD